MLINVIFLLSIAFLASAESPNHPAKTEKFVSSSRIAVVSCARNLNKVTWHFNGTAKGYYAYCSYEPALESVVYCVDSVYQKWGKSHAEVAGIADYFNQICSYYVTEPTTITGDELLTALENATSTIQKSYNATLVQHAPVHVNMTAVDRYAIAYRGFLRNLDISNVYGGAICGYFLGIFVIASFGNLLAKANLHTPLLKSRIWNNIRSYITIPTLYHRHAQEFNYFKVITGLIPTRLETIILLGYVVLHTSLIAADYAIDTKNLFFSTKTLQVARYVADRTGIMAFAHFPLIVLFATRNNFLQWLTGIHYTTFIVFHKWVSRMMFLDAMIHAAAYTHYVVINKSWSTAHTQAYWQFGVAATIFAGLLLLFAFYYFRKHCYETFLYAHIILGAVFFYACWEHVWEFGWMEWLYAAIAIWATDRVIRLVRLGIFGFPEAQFELLEGDLVRVTIPKHSKYWYAQPGQYAFIYFWHPLYFWQSHPFTLMDSLVQENEVVIIFKPKEGMTRYIKNRTEKSEGIMKMRVSLEGPYGSSSPLHHYDSLLLLVGGAGLPGPMCHAIKTAEKYKETGKKIKLVLSMRGKSVLEAFNPEFQKLTALGVEIDLYDTSMSITNSTSSGQSSEEPQKGVEDEKITENEIVQESEFPQDGKNGITFNSGRPKLDNVIEEAMEAASSVAIFCCGPSPMVDTIRDLTACYVRKYPQKPIEYFEDYQSW